MSKIDPDAICFQMLQPSRASKILAPSFGGRMVSAADMLANLSERLAYTNEMLMVSTYTYNADLLDRIKTRIYKMVFAQADRWLPPNSRLVSRNHTKIYVLGNVKKGKFRPSVCWFGSGNFVFPDLLYDYFIRLTPAESNEAVKLIEHLWDRGIKV